MNRLAPILRTSGDAPLIKIGPVSIRVLMNGTDTRGALEMLEFAAPGGSPGPQMHTHALAHETFYVLDGALKLFAGDSATVLAPGGTANVPPGVPHRFEYVGEGITRFLVSLTPAIAMDKYFEDLRELFAQGWPPKPESMGALLAKYDIGPG